MTILPDRLRVALLGGGSSAEREVSLASSAQVQKALQASGFTVVFIDTADEGFIDALQGAQADVVFICLHGRGGEDGTVQGLCELLGLPYVGCGVLASALAMDKVMSKLVFTQAGILTPDSIVVNQADEDEVDCEALLAQLGGKVVVKPVNEGSAIGVTIVHSPEELPAALAKAFCYGAQAVAERFIAGTEVTVGVLGNDSPQALPTIEIVPEREFYDYDSKYVPGMSRHIIPADVDDAVRKECQRVAVAAHMLLGCRGMSRADTIVAEDGSVWLLEVNTIPGMTSTSLLPDAAKATGIGFEELCRFLVELALG